MVKLSDGANNGNKRRVATVVIAAFDRGLSSALAGMADMFALSQLDFIAQATEEPDWKVNIIIASQNGLAIEDGSGRIVQVDSDFASIPSCDAVLIPGFVPSSNGLPPENLLHADTVDWLRRMQQQGALLCGSCSGVFVLGEAGILNGVHCTTTWWLHDELKRRYPKAIAAWASEMQADSRVVSAGGPLSWVSITLYIVEQLAGAKKAKEMADFAVVDAEPKSQHLHVPQGYLPSNDPFLVIAEKVIRKAKFCSMSTSKLASSLTTSERTLHRKLKSITGESPKQFIDRICMAHACTLLSLSDTSINRIALDLGYSDNTVFRRVFRKHIGMTPSAYRQKRKQMT